MNRLIERITPFWADRFEIRTACRDDGKEFYTIEGQDGRIVLTGSTNSAIAAAYYRALRECCGMDLSPCGNRKVYDSGEMTPPAKPITQILRNGLRVTMTYESFLADACTWDWNAWEWALDYFAMQGVNAMMMPVGQTAVWYYAALDLGFRREDAMEFLSGPVHYPLQLSGKLDSFLPLTDTNYLKDQIELGKKIIERMRELGMEPILPAFNGHVPKCIKGYHKGAGLFFVTPYGTFPFTYRLFPDEPLFAKIADAMAEKQTAYFGAGRYYFADPFYGVSPRVKDSGLVEAYGKAILERILAHNPDGVWISHSCDYSRRLTDALPDEKVCILDTDGSYDGAKPYVRGIRCNFGGHTVLCGDVGAVLRDDSAGTAGAGVFAESTLVNPLYTALAYRRLTEDAVPDGRDVFVREAIRRWGSDEACLRDAASALYDTCYGASSPAIPVGSVPACRPSTTLSHTAPDDTLQLHYDNRALCSALDSLLASQGDYTDGYVFDVCDILRQVLSNHARRLYAGAMEGFEKRDGRLFETATNGFLRLLRDMNSILSTQEEFCLQTHLRAIGSTAETKTDTQNFEVSYLASLTLFGPFHIPDQYDLLWREWSDLVGTYYAQRWHMLFEHLAKAFPKRGSFSTDCPKKVNGRNPSRGSKFYKEMDKQERQWVSSCTPEARSEDDALDIAASLLAQYRPMIERDQIQ